MKSIFFVSLLFTCLVGCEAFGGGLAKNYDKEYTPTTGKFCFVDENHQATDNYFIFDGTKNVMSFEYFEEGNKKLSGTFRFVVPSEKGKDRTYCFSYCLDKKDGEKEDVLTCYSDNFSDDDTFTQFTIMQEEKKFTNSDKKVDFHTYRLSELPYKMGTYVKECSSYAELRMALHGHLHGGDGFGLVVLDADDALRVGEEPQHDLHALHDAGAVAAHELVVAGDVGLALGAVGDDVLDGQGVLGRQLHMGGEARAAETRDARVGHPLDDLLAGDARDVLLLVKGAGLGVLAVVVDDDALLQDAGDGAALLHRLHRARAGRDDVGGDEAVRRADDLAHQHGVALLDDGLGRFADVLCQGKDHLPLGVESAQRCFLAQFLAFPRMHTAAKGVPHIRSLLLW